MALKRFYNVYSPTPAPARFMTAQSLTVQDVKRAFRGRSAPFLARSAGCATYLSVPELVSYAAKWKKNIKTVTKKRK